MRASVVTLCRYIPYQILFPELQYSTCVATPHINRIDYHTLPYRSVPLYATYTVYLLPVLTVAVVA